MAIRRRPKHPPTRKHTPAVTKVARQPYRASRVCETCGGQFRTNRKPPDPYARFCPKHRSESNWTHPRDPLQLAKLIGDIATGQAPRHQRPDERKNHAAVELGRLGGLKGGKARAEALSAKRRKAIAKKAIATRWKKRG